MPIFEYKCSECGKELEVFQKRSDPPPVCPCKDGDPIVMRKVLSNSTFRLLGGGWCEDGYCRKKK